MILPYLVPVTGPISLDWPFRYRIQRPVVGSQMLLPWGPQLTLLVHLPVCLGPAPAKLGIQCGVYNGGQDMSAFLAQQAIAESGSPPTLPWQGGKGITSSGPCVPDHDLELEWIHGYSAQAFMTTFSDLMSLTTPIACAHFESDSSNKRKEWQASNSETTPTRGACLGHKTAQLL